MTPGENVPRAADVEGDSSSLSEADLRRKLKAYEDYARQCDESHELLDALRVPEYEDDKPLGLAERITWTTLHDDYDDPRKVADTILAASSNPFLHSIRTEQLRAAEARVEELTAAAQAVVDAETAGREAADSDGYAPDHVLQRLADATEARIDELASVLKEAKEIPAPKEAQR